MNKLKQWWNSLKTTSNKDDGVRFSARVLCDITEHAKQTKLEQEVERQEWIVTHQVYAKTLGHIAANMISEAEAGNYAFVAKVDEILKRSSVESQEFCTAIADRAYGSEWPSTESRENAGARLWLDVIQEELTDNGFACHFSSGLMNISWKKPRQKERHLS